MDGTGAEHDLLARLRSGDERAFVELVERHHRALIRLASVYVARPDIAEDVAQETWLALLNGLDRFEGRSSLRTWLFAVCINRARSIGKSEHRTTPVEFIEPAVDAAQFSMSGAWTAPLTPWPEDTHDDADLVELIRTAIADLPTMQRLVVTLRDIDGLTSTQACQVLSISEGNQRILLHRGRAQIRRNVDRVVTIR